MGRYTLPDGVVVSTTSSTPTGTSTSSATSMTAASPATSSISGHGPSNGGLIGGIVGGVIILILLALVIFIFLRRKKRRQQQQQPWPAAAPSGGTSGILPAEGMSYTPWSPESLLAAGVPLTASSDKSKEPPSRQSWNPYAPVPSTPSSSTPQQEAFVHHIASTVAGMLRTDAMSPPPRYDG